jgi:hypothetical protein
MMMSVITNMTFAQILHMELTQEFVEGVRNMHILYQTMTDGVVIATEFK